METLQVVLDVFTAIAPWNIILGIITVLITGSLAFVFGWFSIRYATAAIFDAIVSGKIKLSYDNAMGFNIKNKRFKSWYLDGMNNAISRQRAARRK